MPTIPFTVRKLESLKPPESGRIDYWDEGFPGFGLRISDRDTRTWVLMYRTKDGRQRRLKIGTASSLGLAAAHQKAKDALHDVEHGRVRPRLGTRSAAPIRSKGLQSYTSRSTPSRTSGPGRTTSACSIMT